MKNLKKVLPAAALALLDEARRKPVYIHPSRLDSTSHVRRHTEKLPTAVVLALVHADRKVEPAHEHEREHELQRNTKGRASDVRKTGYLRFDEEVLPTQHHVQLVFWQGEFEGLDANTRMFLWADASQTCKVPQWVDATFFFPKDEREYWDLYLSVDSKQSHKTDQHILYGILKSIGLEPASPLFRSYKVVSTIKYVANLASDCSAVDLLQATSAWEAELRVLDSWGFRSKRTETFSTGVWVALVQLLRTESDPAALNTFVAGIKAGRQAPGCDAALPRSVNAFVAAYSVFKAPGTAANVPAIAKLTRQAFEAFCADAKERSTVRARRRPSLTAQPKAA